MGAAERCASCFSGLNEDAPVFLTEGKEILCELCGTEVEDLMPDEIAKKCTVAELHPDWRTT